MINRELKKELNELSKEVFGSSSRWAKLVETGVKQVVMEEVTEYVPGATDEEEGTTRVVKVPVKKNGMVMHEIVRHTPESVKQMMLELKTRRDAYFAHIKKLQEEQAAKKEQEEQQKKVHEALKGSSIG